MRVILALILVFGTFVQVPAQETVSGIYSGFQFNEEEGDLFGIEIMIFPSGNNPKFTYSALVQIANGEAPIATLVPLKEKNGKVEFILPARNREPERRYTGQIKNGELIVRQNGGAEEHLKRGKSYWQ